ncbi:MAG TPA: ribosome maturation factor RimP [bacterium]|nr:ribosome maturation factor RimP [bacterium]
MGLLDETKNTQLRDLAEGVAKDNFLELFDFKVRPQGKKLVLTVVLDKKSASVSVDDCTAVSRDLEKKLDELDLIETSYILEVSSPGLDRPLRSLEDCERFKGRKALITLSEPLEGQVSLEGRLGEVNDGKVEMLIGNERTLWVPFTAVKAARLVVEL